MNGLDKRVTVLVIGAGAMGSGIAQVAAAAGHPVVLHDARAGAAAAGREAIGRELQAAVRKGRMTDADAAATLARVRPAASLADGAGAGLAIEAIVEDLAVKQALFAELEALLPADAILATNTSSLSITRLGAALARPGRLAGMHFFNPATRMKLVEVVSGLATDPAVAACLHATAAAWGKVPVHAKSTPGFIVNRVARPFYAEALRVLDEQAGDPATLDALMREAGGFPMGPFELMDLIGHDVNFAVTRSVFEAYFGDPRFTPSLIQQELVAAGRLGRKSGRGFFAYGEGAARPQPAVLAACGAPSSLVFVDDGGPAAVLARRIEAAGIRIARCAPGAPLPRDGVVLALSDGRTATARAVDEGVRDLVLFDLALDYATTPRLAVAAADTCVPPALDAAVGALQAAGIAVSRLDDVAGLLVLRTVAMLANEGADAVRQGVASASDVDAAMRMGTNYPRGPLAWAEAVGVARVVALLGHLGAHYGEDRYRTSPWLKRRALAA